MDSFPEPAEKTVVSLFRIGAVIESDKPPFKLFRSFPDQTFAENFLFEILPAKLDNSIADRRALLIALPPIPAFFNGFPRTADIVVRLSKCRVMFFG